MNRKSAILLLMAVSLSGCGEGSGSVSPSKVLEHRRYGDHLNIEIDLLTHQRSRLIQSMTSGILKERGKAEKAGELKGLNSATIAFWIMLDGEREPLATFDYTGAAFSRLSQDNVPSEVISEAHSRARPPRGDLLLSEECNSFDTGMRFSQLCLDAAAS